MPAWITGVGAVSCVGETSASLWQAALESRSGLVDGLGRVTGHPQPRSLRMACQAADEAMAEAGWSGLNSDDGFILATTTGQVSLWDEAAIAYLRADNETLPLPRELMHQPLGNLLDFITKHYRFDGRRTLVTSACSAATQAIGLAAQWLAHGRVRRCLVGGVEELCQLTVNGFRSLQLLSDQNARPFDRARTGINLSEGAGFLCLERERGRAISAVTGWGMTSDAHHMTSPHAQGEGSYRAMKEALRVAGVSQVDWVHAHGTGSQANDAAEGQAIAHLLGSRIAVSSTKSVHGHALGASGALEAALIARALERQTLLPTAGLREPDLVAQVAHVFEPRPATLRHVLKNTLGFGGTNAALVFSHAEALA